MKALQRVLSLLMCVVLLITATVICAPAPSAENEIGGNANQYKIRLLVIEMQRFDCSNKAFGGKDSDPYVNYGAQYIDDDADWCRVDYCSLNGTGAMGHEYITLYDRDGDGRYNVVSSFGSSGGYFPSKDGILINGFPTYLYAQYYKVGNSWTGNNGQFKIYLQIAKYQNGTWVWSEGTNTSIGDASMNDSFGSDAQATYGGGVVEFTSNASGANVNNVVLKAEGRIPNSAFPKAQGTASPQATYTRASVNCPVKGDAAVVNSLSVAGGPTDQYGVKMSARVELQGESSNAGISQVGADTYISSEANLPGGDYNAEQYNSQSVTATVIWPQAEGDSVSAQASFKAIDCKYPVVFYNSNNEICNQTDYYYGTLPTFNPPAKAYDSDYHYLNPSWNHSYERVSDTSVNAYYVTYELQAHSYDSCESVSSDYHRVFCRVDSDNEHFIQQAHHFTSVTVEPTCKDRGYTRYTCDDCGYSYDTAFVATTAHRWGEAVITTQPTCEQTGVKTVTCLDCGTQQSSIVSALGHSVKLRRIEPTDNHPGGAYFICERCELYYWAAVYNANSKKYVVKDETAYVTPWSAVLNSGESIPAPSFNVYKDTTIGYDYFIRGASLKYQGNTSPATQPLRFAAAVRVPENVDFRIRGSGNAVTDIGFVYSLKDLVSNAEDLALGKEQVQSMSVKDRNTYSGIYNGYNWGGVSKHEDALGTTDLTFNLVIDVKQEHWKKDFCVRPYITYVFNGFTYTVYDEVLTARSVEYIAQKVVSNAKETQEARTYCREHILKQLSEE